MRKDPRPSQSANSGPTGTATLRRPQDPEHRSRTPEAAEPWAASVIREMGQSVTELLTWEWPDA
jgi:hypothetical protein